MDAHDGMMVWRCQVDIVRVVHQCFGDPFRIDHEEIGACKVFGPAVSAAHCSLLLP